MTRAYDNWERLVSATLDREKLRRLAVASSIDTATDASFCSSNTAPSKAFLPSVEGYSFAKSIQLAYSTIRAADDATSFRTECLKLKSGAQKLATLLHQAARVRNQLYNRPARHIIHHTEDVLDKAVTLLLKCQGLKRLFTNIQPVAFEQISLHLSNSISNISWLLRGDEYLLLPPIASDEPVLYHVWEPIGTLYMGSEDEKCDATASLVYWARDDDLYKKLIIEEGGLHPLLRLLKEGKLEAQKNAVMVIAVLGNDGGNVHHLIDAGVFSILARILDEGPIKLQPTVAWALSELTSNGGIFEHHFRPQDIVGLLVSHLKSEDLVKVDSNIHHSITKSKTLLCFAVLLEKRPEAVQYYCAMTLRKATAAAERDADLRTRSGFKLNSPARKAILDQLYRIVDEAAHLESLIPCIKTIGNLATTMNASETRMISPLVKLLEKQQEGKVSREACVALAKHACPGNFLSQNRSKAIIGAGGVKSLAILVYSGEQTVQSPALVLLCFIALNVPHSAQLAEAEVLALLDWASTQPLLIQDEDVKELLTETKSTLVRYQSRCYKGHH